MIELWKAPRSGGAPPPAELAEQRKTFLPPPLPSAARAPLKLLTPRDLYYLIVVLLLAVAERARSRYLRERLGLFLTHAAFTLSLGKRRAAEKNVTCALGDVARAERRRIVRGSFRAFWREMLAWSEAYPDGGMQQHVEVRGLEHLRKALQNGRGAILWESNGFGRRLLAKRALHARGFVIHQVHGANNLGGFLTPDSSATVVRKDGVRAFFDRRESQFAAELIRLPGSGSLAYVRSILNALKRNHVVCLSADGIHGARRVRVRFLRGSAFFASGAVSLARLSGAPLLPLFCTEGARGDGVVTIGAPLCQPGDRGGRESTSDVLQHYAALLETQIRTHPELYRNWHLVDSLRSERAHL